MGSLAAQSPASTRQPCAARWLPLCRELRAGSDSHLCGRTQGVASICAAAPNLAGISREVQASLRQHPGVVCVYGICARMAELYQAATGRCSALCEAAKKQKAQHFWRSIYSCLDMGINNIASEQLYSVLAAAQTVQVKLLRLSSCKYFFRRVRVNRFPGSPGVATYFRSKY